ncbi:hypothetical protein IVB38_17055 [Bradyrhizobium sp. 38]|uniref:hypothetical protein n=1 Tax=unclassified Bradyrhizobium TaxID=2631580 RepID=UPI001FFAD3C1|nr:MULTISPECIES: hypothetical protein [unclassified Bradyrhizobium]MCK1337689.1 hypothetical protein [Bradyrhizobium sp. 38]MCK1775699.1 hypothetical protein [Bradyrhizobium sp. 132]
MSERRRRVTHTQTFTNRLMEQAAKFREAAERLAPGTERELLMKRADQAEQAAQMSDWLTKPNSAPPAQLDGLLKAAKNSLARREGGVGK